MTAVKSWGEKVTRWLYCLTESNTPEIPGTLSSQKSSAFRTPYKPYGLNPKQIEERTKSIEETYHPDFFDGRSPRALQAREEAIRQLNRDNSTYEERAKKGTKLPM